MQRAPLPASKSDYKITFIDVFYSARPGLPIWMAGRRQHGRKQNASKKFKTQALPRAIETTCRDLTAIISNTPAPPLKKLTDEERKKLSAEGRCFRCRQQGHMAKFCPTRDAQGNTTPRPNATARTTDTNPAKSEPDKTKSPEPSLSKAQQIAAIEKSMTEEERGAYLDERDMGEEDF